VDIVAENLHDLGQDVGWRLFKLENGQTADAKTLGGLSPGKVLYALGLANEAFQRLDEVLPRFGSDGPSDPTRRLVSEAHKILEALLALPRLKPGDDGWRRGF
jgi:hypothetical protein